MMVAWLQYWIRCMNDDHPRKQQRFYTTLSAIIWLNWMDCVLDGIRAGGCYGWAQGISYWRRNSSDEIYEWHVSQWVICKIIQKYKCRKSANRIYSFSSTTINTIVADRYIYKESLFNWDIQIVWFELTQWKFYRQIALSYSYQTNNKVVATNYTVTNFKVQDMFWITFTFIIPIVIIIGEQQPEMEGSWLQFCDLSTWPN